MSASEWALIGFSVLLMTVFLVVLVWPCPKGSAYSDWDVQRRLVQHRVEQKRRLEAQRREEIRAIVREELGR